MADGEIKLTLTGETARKLREAAERAGISPEDMGVEILAGELADPGLHFDFDPAIDEAIADRMEATGEGIPLAAFLERMKTFGRRGE